MGSLFKYIARSSKTFRTLIKGMAVTFRYMKTGFRRHKPKGIADPGYFESVKSGNITIQYPQERIPVPDTGRYRLFMETEDCIGCDKCARICPVDCITIETFRAAEPLGQTSDGTTKRLHLPVFDIDMGKCMFCGLCTTVCPTECLTMSKVYDYSEFDRDNLVYHFGGMDPQTEFETRKLTEIALDRKKQESAAKTTRAGKVPVRKPVIEKPLMKQQEVAEEGKEEKPAIRKKPIIRRKPVMKKPTEDKDGIGQAETTPEKPKPKKPVMKRPVTKKPAEEETDIGQAETIPEKPKPKKPVMKRPVIKKPAEEETGIGQAETTPEKPKPKKPVMKRPVMKKKDEPKTDDAEKGGDE